MRRGFSLIEVMVAVGITAIIAVGAFLVISGRQSNTELQATASEMVSALRTAQQNALSAVSSTAWGVRFDNTTSSAPRFVVFAAPSYTPSAEVTAYPMSKKVQFDPSTIASGTASNVIFGLKTGTTASTTIMIRAVGTQKTYTMTISPLGIVTATYATSTAATSSSPTASGITPNSGNNTGVVTISSISGTNFVSGATVKLTRSGQSDISGSGFTVVNGTTISTGTFNLTSVQAGTWNVVVTNPNNDAASCTGCFTVNSVAGPPTVTSPSPNSAVQGTTVTTTITGAGFVSGATTAFSGTGITVNNTTFVSSTSLNVNITLAVGATVSSRNITVTNPDAQQGSCTSCFSVTAGPPTVTSVSPNARGAGAMGSVLTITGTNFTSGAVVTFSGGGITVTTSSVTNATTMSATVNIASTSTESSRDVTVTNPSTQYGTGLAKFDVTVAPSASSLNPSAATQGASGLDVAITGDAMKASTTFAFSGTGITVNTVTFTDKTNVTINITVDGAAAVGARDITLTNPDGGTRTFSGLFTVNAGASQNLIAHWSFNEADGSVAADDSGNGLDGSLNNDKAGWFKDARTGLDMNTFQMTVADNPLLQLTGDMTISWIWNNTMDGTNCECRIRHAIQKGTFENNALEFKIDLDPGMYVSGYGGSASGWGVEAESRSSDLTKWLPSSGSVLSYNDFHMVTVTRSGTQSKVYEDGSLVYTASYSQNAPNTSSTDPLTVGPFNTGLPVYIDDLRIYDYALSSSQVATLYGQIF